MPKTAAYYGALKMVKSPLRYFLKNRIMLLFDKTMYFFSEIRIVEESGVVRSAGGEKLSGLIDERFNVMDA